MTSMTCDMFLNNIGSERDAIASLSNELEIGWLKCWLLFGLLKMIYKHTDFLKYLENWENDKTGIWQDQKYLNKVKNNLEELTVDLNGLAEKQIKMNLYPQLAQIELGLVERFEDKIEMLSISTDPAIQVLVAAVGENVSH